MTCLLSMVYATQCKERVLLLRKPGGEGILNTAIACIDGVNTTTWWWSLFVGLVGQRVGFPFAHWRGAG